MIKTNKKVSNKNLETKTIKSKKKLSTSDLTFLKENTSKVYFCNKDANLDLVKKNTPAKLKNYIEEDHLQSAEKQRKALEQYFNLENYKFYLQNEGLSKLIYDKIKGNGIKKDNWNPSDIWGFHKSLTKEKLKKDLKNIEDNNFSKLNQYIKDKIDQKQIIPVSLKHIEKKNRTAHIEFKETPKKETKVEIKLLKLEVCVKDSNIFIENTIYPENKKEYIQIRFGKATNKIPYLESFKSNLRLTRDDGHSLGSFSKKDFKSLTQKYNYDLTLKEYQELIISLYDLTPNKNNFFIKYNLNRSTDTYEIKNISEYYNRIKELGDVIRDTHFVTLQMIQNFLKALKNNPSNQLLAYKLIHKISDTSSPYFLLS